MKTERTDCPIFPTRLRSRLKIRGVPQARAKSRWTRRTEPAISTRYGWFRPTPATDFAAARRPPGVFRWLLRGRIWIALLVLGGVSLEDSAAVEVTVMTRNIYLGTSLSPLFEATNIFQIPGLVSTAWMSLEANRFPERAQALADEIAAARPHLVGLQEVSHLFRQSPGDFLLGNPVPATQVAFDYLSLLLEALEARGVSYRAVAIGSGVDLEVPMAEGDDIRVIDREVILARDDVEVANPQTSHFEVNLSIPFGEDDIAIPRSWVAVDATVAGQTFQLVSTHLETAGSAAVQVAQGDELLERLADVALPLILVGDFNSAAGASNTATYANIQAAGFVDAYEQANPGDPGFTCCHADDLQNPAPQLNRRIDHIFFQGPFAAVQAQVVGDQVEGRTASGLWPSDHAGLVASLEFESDVATAVISTSWGQVKVSIGD